MKILTKITRALLLPALIGYSMCLFAQSSANREYQVKAAFLFNFTQFVEWPASAFANANSPLVIGVLGKNPFGTNLEETVLGETANGHPLIVQHYNSIDDIKNSHVLFINYSESSKQALALDALKGRSVLTVSDTPDFLKQNGMIRFFTKSNKIQLQINLDAAKASKLTISSKLLRLAEIFVP